MKIAVRSAESSCMHLTVKSVNYAQIPLQSTRLAHYWVCANIYLPIVIVVHEKDHVEVSCTSVGNPLDGSFLMSISMAWLSAEHYNFPH